MATAILIPIEEYLHTSYEDGDREYIDGKVLERNLGEVDHGDLQSSALVYLRTHYKHLVWAAVEVRVKVKATLFRVPDVAIVLGHKPSSQVISEPPFIVIEVLSPEDRAGRLQAKIADYLAFGIAYIWVLDPGSKTAVAYTREGILPLSAGELRTAHPEIVLPLSELFA